MRAPLSLILIGFTLSTTTFAATAHRTPEVPQGRSIGSPTDGHLAGGAHLPDAPYLRVMPADQAGDVRWGLGALVGMVERAAQRVRHLFPGAVLNVGHLSKNGGGGIEQHASHESGRDADLPFYVLDGRSHQIFADHMVSFRGDGTAPAWPGARFDDARNWALVASLLDDPIAHVTHIFVSSPLRQRLLAYAAHTNAPDVLRTRAAIAMVQPHGTLPHDDHFHVRIGCPAGMTSCIENPIVHLARAHRGRTHGRGRVHVAAHHEQRREHAHAAEPRDDVEAPAAIVVQENEE